MPAPEPRLAVVSSGFRWDDAIAAHGRRVVVALLARGAPLHQAEDLAQEAWALLIRKEQAGGLKTIELPGLAVRQALFLLQDAQRKSTRETEELAAAAEQTTGLDLERNLLSREELQRASRALAALSPRAKEVFEFVYGHPELRHEEAANRLSISLQRLRQTLYEVRQRVRAALEEAA
ncbi:MAG: RNA polymerase sigma factor [Myxococcaceae bacterium]